MYCVRPIFSRCRLALILGLALLACAPVLAQSVAVSPARLVSGTSTFPSALFRPTETAQLNWTPAANGMQLKIGDAPGIYRRVSVSVSDLTRYEFTPQSLGLPVGVYHANVTNSSQETFRDIREDARTNPSVVFSPDFTFVVESPSAPAIVAPRGTIFNSTPTFEWEGIAGVAAYLVAVSSTPFELRTDPNTNDPVVEGLTPVWGALTTETSARYGQATPNSPYPNLPAPPLEPGREYYFTVLNAYSKTDIALISEAFGGVVAFRYEAFTGLLPPSLTSPLDGARFSGDASIRFVWEPVVDAASYTFTVTERQVIGGSIGDVPVFTLTTPATEVVFDASRLMRRGTYRWSVIPNEANGAAGLSASRVVSYDVPMGRYRFRPKSRADGTAILGVRVEVENLDGRHAPIVPLVNSTETYSDSLVVGRYLFHATREQFADTTYALTIAPNQLTEVNLEMRPLPARISGRVLDDSGSPVENARTKVLSAGSLIRQSLTDAEGRYSTSIPPGRYSVRAEREGFAPIQLDGVEVASSEQAEVPDLILEAVAGFVSGRVLNEAGQPVQLATVTAQSAGGTQQFSTDAEGNFDFTLAAGAWTLEAAKEGFLGGLPVQVQVARGERQSNVTVVLTEQASQVTGSVVGLRVVGGQPDRRVLADVTVRARPLAGPVLSTTTDGNGQFVLNLGAGSYVVTAASPGYEISRPAAVRLGFGESVSGLALEMNQAASRITGRVLDTAGLAVPDARVVLDPDQAIPMPLQVSSDGRFEVWASAGRHRLRVSAPGHGVAEIEVGLGEAGLNRDIVLRNSVATIAGRVTRAGASIPFALVTATSARETATQRTDANGSYELGLPPGVWSIRIQAEGHQPSSPVSRTLLAGQELRGLNVDLQARESSLQGVVTSAGNAVGAATISLQSAAMNRFTVVRSDGQFAAPVLPDAGFALTVTASGYDPARLQEPALAGGATRTLAIELQTSSSLVRGVTRGAEGLSLGGVLVSSGIDSTRSAFDGTYVLPLPPGTRELHATKSGYAPEARTVTLALGEQRGGVDFDLAPAFSRLLVAVVGPGSVPIPGALATLRSAALLRTATTDASGAVSFADLPAGAYDLEVKASGHALYTDGSLILAAGATRQYQALLSTLEGRIAGRVLDSSASPLAGVHVDAGTTASRVSGVTQADGRFDLAGLPGGLTDIRFERVGYETGRVEAISVVPGVLTDLGNMTLIRHTGSVSGRISAQSDGRPLSGALITLSGDQAATSTTTTDQGTYSLSAIPPGIYDLEATLAGFRRASMSITIGPASTADLQLGEADATVSGRVLDENGASLGFPVRIAASAAGRVVSVISEAEGGYVVTGLDPGETWTLRTEINRPGYDNATREVSFGSGISMPEAHLAVKVRTARIVGSAGIPGASVRLLDAASGEVRSLTRSLSNGSYAFPLLASGSYSLVPEKEGVAFTPPVASTQIGQGGTATVNFTAIAQVGAIQVRVLNLLRQPIAGVAVVASSSDGLVVRSGTTDISGLVVFDGLPLSQTYELRPSLAGFSSSPRSLSVPLDDAAPVVIEFTMTESTGSIAGSITSESGEPLDGNITALDLESGILYLAEAANGAYVLERLPGGTYEVTASAPGFRPESLRVFLAESELRSGVNFDLRPASVRMQGRVLYRGSGVEGVLVRARARTEQVTQTDAQGAFLFASLPLDVLAPDTTVYLMTIEPAAGQALSRTVSIPGERLGQVINVDDVILPSGRIGVSVTDGVAALVGAEVAVIAENGSVLAGATSNDGVFSTSATLAAGDYRVTVRKQGFLSPSGEALEILLAGDTEERELVVAMPFRHEAVTVASSLSEIPILVPVTGDAPASSLVGSVTYTVRGVSQTVSLARSDDALRAAIPATNGEESVRYEILVVSGGVQYRTGPHTITPQTPGKLAIVRLEPALSGSRLRVGDTYPLRALVLDGIGSDLGDRFGQGSGGRLSWSLASDHASLAFPDPADPTHAVLTVGAAEVVRLELTAVLGSAGISLVEDFQVVDDPLEALTLSTPASVLGNRSPGVQLNYRARLADGGEQLLGQGLSWTVTPSSAGRVTETGVFIPGDDSMIGPITVRVADPASGKRASTAFSLVRDLDPGEGALLRGTRGADLVLPDGAIPFAARIGLAYPPLAGPKRNARIGAARYTAGHGLVRYSMSSDRALLGDSLLAPAQLELPADGSLRLLEGERFVGQFDTERLGWRLLPTKRIGESYTSNAIRHLAEFSVLAANESLGLRNVAVLPTPFSPDIAPLKIGFVLTTTESSASVSVRIYNLQGQLVRTVLQSELLESGRYGSASSRLPVEWDGTTDAGSRARNGRYIIRLEATDTSGTASEQVSVVLVR